MEEHFARQRELVATITLHYTSLANRNFEYNEISYDHRTANEAQLTAKLREIEQSFDEPRNVEYNRLKGSAVEDIDMRSGMEYSNLKIVIDDLHKEVAKFAGISTSIPINSSRGN